MRACREVLKKILKRFKKKSFKKGFLNSEMTQTRGGGIIRIKDVRCNVCKTLSPFCVKKKVFFFIFEIARRE